MITGCRAVTTKTAISSPEKSGITATGKTVRTARRVFPIVAVAGDQPTADLLPQRLDVHEKTAWMLLSVLA